MQGPPVSSGEKRTLVAWVKRAMVLVGAWFTHGLWVEVGIIRIAMIVFDGSLAPLHTRRLRALPSRSQRPNREAACRGSGVTTIGRRVCAGR